MADKRPYNVPEPVGVGTYRYAKQFVRSLRKQFEEADTARAARRKGNREAARRRQAARDTESARHRSANRANIIRQTEERYRSGMVNDRRPAVQSPRRQYTAPSHLNPKDRRTLAEIMRE